MYKYEENLYIYTNPIKHVFLLMIEPIVALPVEKFAPFCPIHSLHSLLPPALRGSAGVYLSIDGAKESGPGIKLTTC